MSLVMLCFPCCVDEQPPPRRRPKIDREMIGAPMNFKHTGHIGSGEVSTGFDIHNVQDQMQSKGGYKFTCALSEAAPDGLDLTSEANEQHENANESQSQVTAAEDSQDIEECNGKTESPVNEREESSDRNETEDMAVPSEPNRTADVNQL